MGCNPGEAEISAGDSPTGNGLSRQTTPPEEFRTTSDESFQKIQQMRKSLGDLHQRLLIT